MAKFKKLTEEEMLRHKKRFMQLNEYTFVNQESDLLLDEDDDEDESPEGKQPEGIGDVEKQGQEDNISLDEPKPHPDGDQMPQDDNAGEGDAQMPQMDTNTPDMSQMNTQDNEVELDVTDLTKKQDDVVSIVNNVAGETETIMSTLMSLSDKIEKNIKNTESEISNLKKELVKRNPTPVEVLQKRITVSDPFNQTPADYWSKKEKEGKYRLYDEEDSEKEYELKSSDINGSANEIYKSLGVTDDEMNQSLSSMFNI